MELSSCFCTLLTAVADPGEDSSTLFSALLTLAPWVLILVFIWYFVLRGAMKTQTRSMEQIDRSFEYMERCEAQQERMIALLEQLNDKLDRQQ